MEREQRNVYFERLWPSPMLFVTLLLIIPAVTLTLAPINQMIAVPAAITVYVLTVVSITLMAPTIRVTTEAIVVRGAAIPLSVIGAVKLLDRQALKLRMSTQADARAFLVVRGDIHYGVEIEINDDADETPYCIFTTRKPQTLLDKIEYAKRVSL